MACIAKLKVMNSTMGRKPAEGRADAEPRKASLRDRRVNHAARAELVEQALRDLVRALVLGNLLAHHENSVVAAHFLRHGVAQGFAHGDLDHLRAFRDLGRAVIPGWEPVGGGFADPHIQSGASRPLTLSLSPRERGRCFNGAPSPIGRGLG